MILPKPLRKAINDILFYSRNLPLLLRRFNISPCSKYSYLKKYRNIHKGERCFIIATGPSLTISDIEKLHNEITFSMNSICLAFKDTPWRPTYYAVFDLGAYKNLIKVAHFSLDEIKNVFISNYIAKHIMSTAGALPSNYNVCHVNSHNQCIQNVDDERKYIPSPHKIMFSKNIDVEVNGINIAYSALQIAVYMGFSEIYLLGCDCNFEIDKKLHSHIIEYEIEGSKLDQLRFNAVSENLILSYKAAKKYADAHGIKIFNATRGGKLEVFERVDLDEVLKHPKPKSVEVEGK